MGMTNTNKHLNDIDDLLNKDYGKDKVISNQTSKTNINNKISKDKDNGKKEKTRKPKPIIKRNKDGKIIELELSSSIIKQFTFKTESIELCPLKEYHNTILKDLREPTTLSQQKGLFFETLCLGISAGDNKMTDLPRKPNGEKTVAQERIEEQVVMFERFCDEHNVIVIPKDTKTNKKNIQIKQKVEWDTPNLPIFDGVKIIIKMEADLISPIKLSNMYDYDVACIDLKLTKDRDSTFSRFGWGNPDNIDHIQAYIYSWMLEMPFTYLIFDYKPNDRGWKFLPVNMNTKHSDANKANDAKIKLKEMHQSIRQTAQSILNYDNMEWHTEPDYDRCKNCPVYYCKDKETIKEL